MYSKPLPRPNADTKEFWKGCREHELRFQKCKNCDHVRWPPSVICPQCHSFEAKWIVSGGTGAIYSYVVYHIAFHPAFKKDLPYATAVVKLAEGPKILTNIVGCRPSELFCEMPVNLVWEDVSETVSLPKFTPFKD